ncbi:ankyrin repeat and protein kinase domain-containing protein 1 [Haematococcus lacustris]|uniref:Ankyrin repeat and protein kinase domain-containing protein 1 n=1 Tax=Haematococcus lacustris TaxID=44745 RepID=A0A699ZQA8_HAELA|nr:ankyrin repeat and protein kinase domain-containing protein 1 [Haematococcus lacustris]
MSVAPQGALRLFNKEASAALVVAVKAGEADHLCHPSLSPTSVTHLCHPPLSPTSVTHLCHPSLGSLKLQHSRAGHRLLPCCTPATLSTPFFYTKRRERQRGSSLLLLGGSSRPCPRRKLLYLLNAGEYWRGNLVLFPMSSPAGDYAAAGEAIRLGADANTVDLPTGRMTPLHFAVSAGRVHTHDPPAFSGSTAAQLTRLLLRYGARAGAGDYMGFTPLHLAAFHNLPGVLDLLLGNLQQQPGRLASLLLLQDSEIKYTPLHCAVEGHHASAVVSLLQAGAAAGLDAKDWTSRTAWNLAAVQ